MNKVVNTFINLGFRDGTIAPEDLVIVLSGTHGATVTGTQVPATALTYKKLAEKNFFDEDEEFVEKLKEKYPNHRQIGKIIRFYL